MRPSTVGAWLVSPIRRRTSSACATTSKPATAALPAEGRASVVRMRIAVVLPAPLWPSSPSTEPAGTSRSKSRRAH